MARAQKLKVYRTAAGFDDAYVAAPSQKAALSAWGSDKDLFARGIAEIVTDPALTAGPLATPGVVVRHSRGTTAEQIEALPDPAPRPSRQDRSDQDATSGRTRQDTPSATKKPPPAPKPSSDTIKAAEDALETVEAAYDRRLKALADREAALARERRDLETARRDDVDAANAAVEKARRAYDAAMRKWRTSRAGA